MMIRVLATLLILLFAYVPSIVADRWISYGLEIEQEIYKRLTQIRLERIKTEDEPQRDILFKSGFKPAFFPKLVSRDKDLLNLAKKYAVAPLAPQPSTNLYYCNEGYGTISYKSDRFGFRNQDFLWDISPKIFLVGDSFVQGACIPDFSDTIVGRINDKSSAVGLGSGGNGAIHYASLLKAFVSKFAPKNVVVVFYHNDNELSENDNEKNYFYEFYWLNEAKPYLVLEEGRYVLNRDLLSFYRDVTPLLISKIKYRPRTKDNEIPEYAESSANQVAAQVRQEIRFWNGITLDNFRLKTITNVAGNIFSSEETELPFSNILAIEELKRVCAVGCEPMVVYIPNSRLWQPDARAVSYSRSLGSFLKSMGIEYLDMTETLRGYSETEVYAPKGLHLSPRGYKVVADALSERLGL